MASNENLQAAIKNVIGEDGMIINGLLLFMFLDPSGQERFAFISIEDPSFAQSFAMLSFAEHSVAEQWRGKE